MSDYCRHGECEGKCKTCKLEEETPVGDWYVYVYNTSDRAIVSDQGSIKERCEDVKRPVLLLEVNCGDVPAAQNLVMAHNEAIRKARDQEVSR